MIIKHIAVLRALYVGDFICAEPALRALKTRFPRAELTYIGLPWVEPFLARYRYVDHFLPFPGCRGIGEVPYDAAATEAFLNKAGKAGYDLAIQMHGSGPESNDFVAGLGAAVSLGYTPPGFKGPLSHPIIYPGDRVHEAHKWLGLVAHVGAAGLPRPELPVLSDEAAQAQQMLSPLDRSHPIVALHAGSREAARRWPPERFAALADQLWDQQGCQIVLTGGPDDIATNALVRRACRAPALDLAGKTGLGSLAALLERVDLLVTNDTGPSHIAWARGVPSVVLFGPSDPGRWAPLDTRRHRTVISPDRNLQHLTLAQVWPTVAAALHWARSRQRPA